MSYYHIHFLMFITAMYTVIGTPFSTFTRTVTMGLHELGISFTQEACLPHSELVCIAQQYGIKKIKLPKPTGSTFLLLLVCY